MRYAEHFRRGITLIEVLVVVAIIAIMTAVSLVLVRGGLKVEEVLDAESRALAVSLREIQDNALNGKQIFGENPSCGFGLHYVPGNSEWSTYALLRRNTWDDCSDIVSLADDSTSDTPTMVTWEMRAGVSLVVSNSIQDAAFNVPFADVFLYDTTGADIGSGDVVFELRLSGERRYVCLKKSGLVIEGGETTC